MTITYDDIRKANDTIVTMPIERKDKKTGQVTSKDYAEVNQRIKAFRMVYPQGTIKTEMVSNENGICIFKACCGYYEGTEFILIGTGTAYEKEGSSYINATSYIENCETSAVGRALGMAGFGIDTSIASAEEVRTAMAQQRQQPAEDAPEECKNDHKASAKQLEILRNVYKGENLTKLLNMNGVKRLEDLPATKAYELIGKLRR